METLLKKAWESVSNRSISISEKMQGGEGAHASTGSFNRVPDEIFILILKSLGPKEAAKLAVVCKTWRTIVSDNRLWMYFFQSNEQDSWDSIFFAEAHLRFGYPLQKFCNQTPPLSYKRIYGQRAQVPVSVIIDGGSGYCKFGWSKDRCPSGRSATFLEFGNIESPMYSRLRHFFATIYSRMQAKPTNQPIVVVTPICHYDDTESDKASRRQLKEAIYSALFYLNVPAVCAINQATLALYAARQASGIVVNIGFQQTSVVPILHGKVMCNVGVEIVGMGASKLTGFLREQMQQMNIHFESLYTIRELKEKLCYVALDYEAELSKDTQASYKVSREGTFTLSKERFQAGEILFQPRIAGVRAMGLHQAVALCIDHCHDAELMCDDSWFKTVVLSGGTACLPGLPGRLEKELHELLPPSMASGIRVIPPPFGVDSAWFGAKAISNLSTFPGTWCVTKKQFKYKFRKNLIGPW